MMVAIPSQRSLQDAVRQTRQAARRLAHVTTSAKNAALEAIAQALEERTSDILTANREDVEAAIAVPLPSPLVQRLKLDANKLAGMVAGVRDVARLADPTGVRQIHRQLDDGLVLSRISCPMGVIGFIFESRPDAVTQISALAIKSGNGAILKGGSEAVRSCTAIVTAIQAGLAGSEVDPQAIQLLTTRAEIAEMLRLERDIDLIVPRGSNDFVRYIQENTRIPVIGHAEGICHLYVDDRADLDMAVAIAVDAKVQYPAACNAIETLLVHRAIAPRYLPVAIAALQQQGVTVRACEQTRQLPGLADLAPATEEDWATEYCDLILSVRIVDSADAAIAHINRYGSRHTEAIVTTDPATAAAFLQEVDAASVFHNCSTRFADGFRFGFGAEVGISTQKMPPRGPVGLEGLVTYKYVLEGDGHIVSTYAGAQAKPFQHRDL